MKMKFRIILLSTMVVLLIGCSKPLETKASTSKTMVSVNVHGVNYTADSFRYVISEENNASNKAGGELIAPFNGGGIMCCFTLPKQWRPGLRVNVLATHWLKEDAKGNLPEVSKLYSVEVPNYPGGQVSDVWVLRNAEGRIEVVVSDAEPGSEHWPGKVKGWPEPSLSYQREQWEIRHKIALYHVSVYQNSLKELQENPRSHLARKWDFNKERSPDAIKRFAGPDDKKYTEYLRQRYIDGLRRSEAEVRQLMEEKP